MKTVYIFVNGIRTFPGSSKNWNGRAVTATHNKFADRLDTVVAEKVEYFTPALTRGFLQKHRARKLIKVLNYYDGWRTVVVAHSNGADVVLDALRMGEHRLQRLHLISPAVTWDCKKNGLGALYKDTGTILDTFPTDGRLREPPCLWIAGKDKALKFGGSFLGRMLGYGALGLKGPKPGTLPHRSGYVEPNFGHSEWFDQTNFDKTMNRIWTS